MSAQDRRERRREFRRTSPDAPQGRAAVAVVVSLLLVVALVGARASGFPWSGEATDSVKVVDQHVTSVPGDKSSTPEQLPTTTLITGSTAAFVATTTPIVTTSSTSSTTTTTTPVPAAKRLKVSPTSLSFSHTGQNESFTVRTPLKGPIGFFVTEIPPGFAVSGRTGSATKNRSATVTVQMVDRDAAQSGRIVVVGADGANVGITIEVQGKGPQIVATSIESGAPKCNTPVRLQARVTGDPTSVRANVTVGSSTLAYPMSPSSDATWDVTVPGRSAGTSVSVTVVASDENGAVDTRNMSYQVGAC